MRYNNFRFIPSESGHWHFTVLLVVSFISDPQEIVTNALRALMMFAFPKGKSKGRLPFSPFERLFTRRTSIEDRRIPGPDKAILTSAGYRRAVCSISDFQGLLLDNYHRYVLERELSMWHLYYLPHESLAGKTVLDLGAGCGETAQFFLNHGANRVVCIEPDSKSLEYLRRNFGDNPRVVIVPVFVDHIKIDIEGAEEGMIFEAHFPMKVRKLSGSPRETLWRVEKRTGPWAVILVKVGPRVYRLIRGSPFEGVAKRLRNLVG